MSGEYQNPLSKEDYTDPKCPFTTPGSIERIPVKRIFEKLDSFFAKNDTDSAEKHLKYWIEEAKRAGDSEGMLSLVNEQIGLYRKLGRELEAFEASNDALALIDRTNLGGSVTEATTLINIATAFKAFGMASDSIPLYEKAKEIYEKELYSDDSRLGGLYNNMALALAECRDFKRAGALFEKAVSVMKKLYGKEAELAITYCNLADLAAAENSLSDCSEAVKDCLEKAMAYFDTPSLPRDGHYAYAAEKCAPTFIHYGFSEYGNELAARAVKIYEGA